MPDAIMPFFIQKIPDYGKASAGDLLLYYQQISTFDDRIDYRIYSGLLAGLVSLLVDERDRLKERLRNE